MAVGGPGLALPLAMAPMLPAPFVPEVLTPLKLITLIKEATFWDKVAVTVTPLRTDGANARQISAVPVWIFVRLTRTQVREAPVI